MNYSPVQHHHTQSREFKSARLSQRGIWITLLQYCTSQENNGIIKNFASWKPAEIRKTLNVDPATLRKKSTLWNMVGEDLHIYGYPHDKQAILNKKRQTLANNTGVQPSPRPENNSSPRNRKTKRRRSHSGPFCGTPALWMLGKAKTSTKKNTPPPCRHTSKQSHAEIGTGNY